MRLLSCDCNSSRRMSQSFNSATSEQSSVILPRRPFIDGSKEKEAKLSVALISTGDIAARLKEVFLAYQKWHEESYKFKLYVHTAERVRSVLSDRNLHIDYFILVADPRRQDIVGKIATDLERVPQTTMAAGRCVIAVSWPEEVVADMIAACSSEVHHLCCQYKLHKIVQCEQGTAGERAFASKLLRLARTARGLTFCGVPDFTTCLDLGFNWAFPLKKRDSGVAESQQESQQAAYETSSS